MNAISIAALVLGVLALGVAIWSCQQVDVRVNERVEQALEQREKALVEKYRPEVDRICNDFGLHRPNENPQTLDELFRPVFKLFIGLHK